MTTSASWIGFTIPLPGQNLLKGVEDILEMLLIFLEICKAILETIKIFLLLFGNPLIALLEALIGLILDLFKALQQTGLYAYFDVADPLKDPNFKALAGGFQAFKTRWKGSLLDLKDANRPQPIAGLITGGFFLFVIDSDGVEAVIQLVKAIISFFKNPNKFTGPQYPPPVHVKAVPLTSTGDAVLSITELVSSQSMSLALEWQLPGNTRTGSNQFGGAISQVIQSFRVPNWLIEFAVAGKSNPAPSQGPPNKPIQITFNGAGGYDNTVMTAPNSTGRLVSVNQTMFSDPRNIGGATYTTVQPILDDNGDPILKMSYYAIIDGFSAFLQAQLGTVRFIFDPVPLDTDIYFRVRGFFGRLDTKSFPVNGNSDDFVTLNWASVLAQHMENGSQVFYLPWPALGGGLSMMSMGKPSAMIHAKLSTVPNFDVIGDIRSLYLAAFSLNLHVALPPAIPEVNASGKPLLNSRGNPIYYPQFNSAGLPIAPLTNADIGKGSATGQAGAVAGVVFPTTPLPSPLTYDSFTAASNPITGQAPQMPWQNPQVIFQATKLSVKIGAMFMEQGTGLIAAFKTLMRGPMPSGPVTIAFSSGVPTYLEQLVKYMTLTEPVEMTAAPGAIPAVTAALAAANVNSTTVDFPTVNAYVQAFNDPACRRNVLAGINFLNALNRQGIPPNWISISLLDLIPWAGQLLYDLIAKIQALVDAFKGVLQEIINFINMLERKITTMEQFIEYLISILNLLLSLEIGFYVLKVPSISGDVTSWMGTLDMAGGTVPQSGPTGYTAGICLAYLGPDVGGIAAAFGLLF